MDAESFLEFASQVTKWKMYPYFDVAHSVLCALHVRDDLGPGNSGANALYWLLSLVIPVCVCVTFHRCIGVFTQAPHFLLAVHDASRLCWGHVECCSSWRTPSSTAQKHSTTFDCYSRVVITVIYNNK